MSTGKEQGEVGSQAFVTVEGSVTIPQNVADDLHIEAGKSYCFTHRDDRPNVEGTVSGIVTDHSGHKWALFEGGERLRISGSGHGLCGATETNASKK